MLDLTLYLEFLRGNWEGLFWMLLALGLLQLPMMLFISWEERSASKGAAEGAARVNSIPRWVDPATAVVYRWNERTEMWEAVVDGQRRRRMPGRYGAPVAPTPHAPRINYANPTVFTNGHTET